MPLAFRLHKDAVLAFESGQGVYHFVVAVKSTFSVKTRHPHVLIIVNVIMEIGYGGAKHDGYKDKVS